MTVTLLGKPGCHLCDDARVIVARVCEQTGTPWQERSILDDPALMDAYAEQIPVVLVDGVVVDIWRIDEARLLTRLTATE